MPGTVPTSSLWFLQGRLGTPEEQGPTGNGWNRVGAGGDAHHLTRADQNRPEVRWWKHALFYTAGPQIAPLQADKQSTATPPPRPHDWSQSRSSFRLSTLPVSFKKITVTVLLTTTVVCSCVKPLWSLWSCELLLSLEETRASSATTWASQSCKSLSITWTHTQGGAVVAV